MSDTQRGHLGRDGQQEKDEDQHLLPPAPRGAGATVVLSRESEPPPETRSVQHRVQSRISGGPVQAARLRSTVLVWSGPALLVLAGLWCWTSCPEQHLCSVSSALLVAARMMLEVLMGRTSGSAAVRNI